MVIALKAGDVDPQRIFGDPANFLHSIDIDGDRAFFLRTDPDMLREASFVDGRTPITTPAPQTVQLSRMLDRPSEPSAAADRFLFNCSFCGSTFLARLLD